MGQAFSVTRRGFLAGACSLAAAPAFAPVSFAGHGFICVCFEDKKVISFRKLRTFINLLFYAGVPLVMGRIPGINNSHTGGGGAVSR